MSDDDITLASDGENVQDAATDVPKPPFPMGKYHKNALIALLHSFHNNRQSISYEELSRRLEVGVKTKSWQCGAYKDLRDNGYIAGSLKALELTEDKGVALASTLVSAEDLAVYQVPDTTEKLHEQIKKRLMKLPKGGKMGVRILDLMLSPDYIPLNRNDMASKFNTLADSHGFFYGLKALKDWGYVVFCDKAEAADLKRRFPDAGNMTDKNETEDIVPLTTESNNCQGEMEKRTVEEDENPNNEGGGIVFVKTESNTIEDETKKRKVENDDEEFFDAQEEETETEPLKKKQYKSKKKRTGGVPLKLSETVFIKST